MTWTLKLDEFSHDLRINPQGKFDRVNSSDEVRQRIKVAMWHYFEEYFLNVPGGVPWYEKIHGTKSGAGEVSLILRRKILEVPGVINIISFFPVFDTLTREYGLDVSCNVESGPGEQSFIQTSITINP